MRVYLLKLGLSIEEATGKPRLGCPTILERQRKGGLGNRFRGLAWDKLPLSIALRSCACWERSGGRRREREWCELLLKDRAPHSGSFVL